MLELKRDVIVILLNSSQGMSSDFADFSPREHQCDRENLITSSLRSREVVGVPVGSLSGLDYPPS